MFLSDSELISVLKHDTTSDGVVIPHLSRIFNGVLALESDSEGRVVALLGGHRERVALEAPVQPAHAKGHNEVWLREVEREMRRAVTGMLNAALPAHPWAKREDDGVRLYTASREEWALDWASQVALTAHSAVWTAHMEEAIVSGNLKELAATQAQNRAGLAVAVRGRLAGVARVTLSALFCADDHAELVTQRLQTGRVHALGEFEWARTLRTYTAEDNTVKASGTTVKAMMRMIHCEQEVSSVPVLAFVISALN